LRDDVAVDHTGIAELLAGQKDTEGARSEYQASISTLTTLVADDPNSLDWANNLAVAHYGLGDLLLGHGDPASAAEHYATSRQLRQDLCDRAPQSMPFKVRLFYTDFRLGMARHQQGDLDAALAAFTGAQGLAMQIKDALSAGEVLRLEQAIKITRDEIAARDSAAATKP
jgi:hypothetical protein